MSVVDPNLKQWATQKQIEYIDAVNELGSNRKAAARIGIQSSTIDRSLIALKRKAALAGYSPDHDMNKTVPDPFIVRGVSTYYNKDGQAAGQWVKSRLDDQAYIESIKEAVKEFILEAPRIKPAPSPKKVSDDIIPWIQIGDAHLGLLAHHNEVGEDFDLKLAELELVGAIEMLIDELPACERMVINDLGDFTHYENFTATTEASGHILDFDSRFPKMIKVYSRVMRAIVDKALTKAKNVDVIINQGNHSRTNDIWMAELLNVCYGQSGRVHVLNNDSVFIAYRMGNTFVMTHHSDKCKPAQLAHVMATDFAKDWGETEHRYIDIGHVHHSMVSKEHPGVFIESFNHLASLDRYAHDKGYRNRKSITVVMRSKQYGEVGRRVLPIQQIRDRLIKLGKSKPQVRKSVYSV